MKAEDKVKQIALDVFGSSDGERPNFPCTGEKIQDAMELSFKAGIKEVWEEVICPMCYRLNPQHVTMDNGKGCHWCQDKEDWCGPN